MSTTTRVRDPLVENVEFLLDNGEHPDRIAARCGYRGIASVFKQLHRIGATATIERLTAASLRAADLMHVYAKAQQRRSHR